MSKIAEAFSSFAKMPAQNLELLDLEEVIDYAIDIFPNSYVTFLKPEVTLSKSPIDQPFSVLPLNFAEKTEEATKS